MSETLPISPDLLEILRDPYAIQQSIGNSSDPGQLELVHNSWLVSSDTGYKYPIRDGIPVMLIEEGRKWQQTAVSDLPVPPPAPEPPAPSPSATTVNNVQNNINNNPLIPIIAGVSAMLLFLIVWKWMRGD